MYDPQPLPRFDWERIIRRVKIPGEVKLLALILGSYGNGAGESIHPGDQRLADVLGCSTRTIRRNRQRLIEMGFIQKTYESKGRGKADEYRLTVPYGVLESDLILDPDEGQI